MDILKNCTTTLALKTQKVLLTYSSNTLLKAAKYQQKGNNTQPYWKARKEVGSLKNNSKTEAIEFHSSTNYQLH